MILARGPYQGMTALCGKIRGKTALVQFDKMDMPGYEPWIAVARRDVHFRRRKTNWSKPFKPSSTSRHTPARSSGSRTSAPPSSSASLCGRS